MVYEDADQRGSWDVHAVKGYYVGPALDSYRCYEVYIPSTRGVRISDTVVWLPKTTTMPGASTNDLIHISLQEIVNCLKNPSPKAPICPLDPTLTEILKTMADLFVTKLPTIEEGEEEEDKMESAAVPRVELDFPKNHRYPTRAPPLPPPPRGSAYVAHPQYPAPIAQPTGGGTSPMEAKEEMEVAMIMTELYYLMEDLIIEDEEPTSIHTATEDIPKGYAMKAVNTDTGELDEYLKLLQSSEGHLWEASCSEEYHRLCEGKEATETSAAIPGTKPCSSFTKTKSQQTASHLHETSSHRSPPKSQPKKSQDHSWRRQNRLPL